MCSAVGMSSPHVASSNTVLHACLHCLPECMRYHDTFGSWLRWVAVDWDGWFANTIFPSDFPLCLCGVRCVLSHRHTCHPSSKVLQASPLSFHNTCLLSFHNSCRLSSLVKSNNGLHTFLTLLIHCLCNSHDWHTFVARDDASMPVWFLPLT